MPRFTLPSNVTFEGGLAGFTIQGPFNAATVVKVGSLVPAGRNRQLPALPPPLLYSRSCVHRHPCPSPQSDVPACKSLITLIDSVLLPFDPAATPAPDYLAVASLVGARGCGVQPNALITGTELKAGDANRHVSRAGWQLAWGKPSWAQPCAAKPCQQ